MKKNLKKMIKKIGFVGLGDMGKPIASNLKNRAINLMVYDIAGTKDRAPKNTIAANSLTALIEYADIIFISVPDAENSMNIIDEVLKYNRNSPKVIINLSTIGVTETQKITKVLDKTPISYIDAPVSGGKTGAINASITVMWSGSKTVLEKLEPYLQSFAKSIIFIGKKPGQGQVMKLLNNFLSAVAISATSEAILLGLKNNLDMKTMLEVLNVSTGKNSASLDKFPNRIATNTFDAGFRMSLMNKDLELYINDAVKNNIPKDIANVVKNYFKTGLDSFPEGDFTEIYKVIRDK